MPDIELARRHGVELVNTGSWQLLSGSWNPNRKDILAAVEAAQCPAVRRPKLKLGHLDRRFNEPDDHTLDGTPSLGWFDNLRASDDGNTLLGDQVALPWLSAVQAAAYPDRSVEGKYNARCALGHTHPFVITAVSLLGDTPPGIPTLKSITSLDDLQAALGVAAAGEEPEGGEDVQATVRAAAQVYTGAMVALLPTAEDAQRLAVDGGEEPEQLHVTLAYLGEAADLGVAGKQDVIDAVSRAANGLPHLDADVFSAAVYNPGDANDRETLLAYQVTGDLIDAVCDLIGEALADMLWAVPIPPQYRPWYAHITAAYTDDLTRIGDLAERMGPVRFDRIRIGLAGEYIDIPLIPSDETSDIAVSAGDQIRGRVDVMRAARVIAASAEPPPDTDPAPVLPAAEPEQEEIPNEEDIVSLSDDMRSWLGLADDADETAAKAAIDELKARADKPVEPTPEMVAASAAATEKAEAAEKEKDELRKEVSVLASQMQQVTGELAAAKAAQAATVKASVFDAAIKEGRIKPADREQWETDYDEAPGAITRVLASIAPGTAVPVMASGHAGPAEPGSGTSFDDAEYVRLFGEKAGA